MSVDFVTVLEVRVMHNSRAKTMSTLSDPNNPHNANTFAKDLPYLKITHYKEQYWLRFPISANPYLKFTSYRILNQKTDEFAWTSDTLMERIFGKEGTESMLKQFEQHQAIHGPCVWESN